MNNEFSGLRRRGINHRDLLRLGAGATAGMAALGLPGFAVAQDGAVLRLIHNLYNQDWSPLRGGGSHYLLNSLWWAAPMNFGLDGTLQPYVFSSWSASDDNQVWSFDLNPDAVFSDGSPITAADVAGSWSLAAMPLTKNQRVNQPLSKILGYDAVTGAAATDLAGVEIVDERRLVVKLSAPDAIFFMRLANHIAPITKVSQSRGADGNEVYDWFTPGAGAAYSGPFSLTSIDLDAGKLAFTANPNFFGPKPQLSAIEIDTVEDDVAALQLIKSGNYHGRTSAFVMPNVRQELGDNFVDGPLIPLGQHYWFNAGRAPTDDVNVRKALIMAVDRMALKRASLPDSPDSVKADQILNVVPGSEDSGFEPYPYDPEAARAALAASKYGGPERLPKLMLVGVSNGSNQAAAQFIAEQWRQNLGITAVEMKPQVDGFSGPEQGSVQIFRDDVSAAVPDAVSYLESAIHSASSNARNKLGGYKNPQIDALLDEASTLGAEDPRRIALAQEAQRVFREEWMFLPWYFQIQSRAVVDSVQNFERNLGRQVAEPWKVTIS